MKTIEEFYNEIISDADIRKQFAKAIETNSAEEFVKSRNCDATKEEVAKYIAKKLKEKAALHDNQLENAVGGINRYEMLEKFHSQDSILHADANGNDEEHLLELLRRLYEYGEEGSLKILFH